MSATAREDSCLLVAKLLAHAPALETRKKAARDWSAKEDFGKMPAAGQGGSHVCTILLPLTFWPSRFRRDGVVGARRPSLPLTR